jgi:hypothetical protein
MSLKIPTPDKPYELDGPYESADGLQSRSGVYVISTKAPDGEHVIIDVGESSDVRDRVTHHDRAEEWPKYVRNGFYISAYYCDEPKRMKVERRIRKHYDPPCGEM